MKKIVIIVSLLIFIISCKAQRELYIVIDTQDTVNMKYRSFHYNKYVNNFGAEYILFKNDPTEDYGGEISLKYRPYRDSILKRWKNTKRLRTETISTLAWEKLKKERE